MNHKNARKVFILKKVSRKCYFIEYKLFVATSHQTGLDTMSMTQRPIIVGI